MEGSFEAKAIKLALAAVVVVAGLLYFVLPRTKLAQRVRMSEPVFMATALIGIACGVVGISATFGFPRQIIDLHLWELMIMPYALIHTYWALIQKVKMSSEIVDEKQGLDLTRAGAVTFAALIPTMAIIFVLFQNGVIEGLVWFPYFLFVGILAYSTSTLFFFKRC